jgi:hypothetical protein
VKPNDNRSFLRRDDNFCRGEVVQILLRGFGMAYEKTTCKSCDRVELMEVHHTEEIKNAETGEKKFIPVRFCGRCLKDFSKRIRQRVHLMPGSMMSKAEKASLLARV